MRVGNGPPNSWSPTAPRTETPELIRTSPDAAVWVVTKVPTRSNDVN
jgi:hypothetical protein